jgi:hypothetical protein
MCNQLIRLSEMAVVVVTVATTFLGQSLVAHQVFVSFPPGMLRRVALVRTDVSEVLSASIMFVTRIGELGTTLAVTSN